MADDPNLENAYALQTPDDSKALYARWAETYDQGFVEETGYCLHVAVADVAATLGVAGPVLDLGAGTGAVGVALATHGIGPLHGTDISAEMLAKAQHKGVYETLFEGDLTRRLPVADGQYASAVSAGTFTNGHVGPDALPEVLRVVGPGGWVILSVNEVHWGSKGFEVALSDLAPHITQRIDRPVPIYDATATGPHANDTARIIALQKA